MARPACHQPGRDRRSRRPAASRRSAPARPVAAKIAPVGADRGAGAAPALPPPFPIAALVVVPGQAATVRVVDVDAGAWIIIVAVPAPIGIAPGSRIADAAIAVA